MQNFWKLQKQILRIPSAAAWIFPMLLVGILWILWQEKDWMRKLLLGILPAGIFIFLLVSVDWIVFHEGFGRKCVLENPVAFTSGGDHSLCGVSSAETVFRALATGGISGITGSHWTGREMCAFLRVV